MAKEALQIQLDSLRLELQQLQVENARLRDERPEMAGEIDVHGEVDRYREEMVRLTTELGELRQLLHESWESEARAAGEAETMTAELVELRERLQASDQQDQVVAGLRSDVERLTEGCQEFEARHDRLTRELEQLHSQAELERYRAVDVERRKWEEREARMVEQLREEKQRPTTPSPGETPSGGETPAVLGVRPSEGGPVTPVVPPGGGVGPSEGGPVTPVSPGGGVRTSEGGPVTPVVSPGGGVSFCVRPSEGGPVVPPGSGSVASE